MNIKKDCLISGYTRNNPRDLDPCPLADSRGKSMWTPWNGTSFRQLIEENMRLQSCCHLNYINTNKQTNGEKKVEVVITVLNLWCRFLIAWGKKKEIFYRCHNSLPNRASSLCTSSCTYQMHLTLWGHQYEPDVVQHLVPVSVLDGSTLTFDGFSFVCVCVYGSRGSSFIFFLLFVMG